MASEKQVSYTSTNTYSELNNYTDKTKNVWLVFHGMGYLSRYFIRYFSNLNPEENYIVAPQAPSKYYQGKNFKHVGASWLTKENTKTETNNVLEYIDRVYETTITKQPVRFIILGYSQGVSIATRWIASRKILCNHLVLHSGGIPIELTAKNFTHLDTTTTVTYLYGDNDEYITEAKKTEESLKATHLFSDRLEIRVFKGVHEVNVAYINEIA
ncbi:alpha/beta hydrolase [Cochleicola gelatinilyticus]|uniref:Esterase n=1 Tax=Cochleicola gelatinilyticus TaxID=1763537 RepID=A0A167HPT1_9FLAO|nr:esterase [Cochleicola gelatinilyticus]OAB78837.1 esterase [Cochleicola gelatinilyticus]